MRENQIILYNGFPEVHCHVAPAAGFLPRDRKPQERRQAAPQKETHLSLVRCEFAGGDVASSTTRKARNRAGVHRGAFHFSFKFLFGIIELELNKMKFDCL